jgi:hypothetical protein
MYNMHEELNKFYEDHVRLKDEQKILAEHRDTNIERLRTGLNELGYPSNFRPQDQGSYAMNTINKHPEKKYDIDEAIVFEKDDLPSNPADARKRIEITMIQGGGNFKKPPEAKTNCVRVSYADGPHVDLAIYRRTTDAFGNSIIEHAGLEWTKRDPVEITNWFNSAVQTKSPSEDAGARVDDGQLRRIVRWLKMFAMSRSNWNMPCGLIISILAEECYAPNQYRDDSSLYDTMVNILNRLLSDEEVRNPVNTDLSLTCREKDKTRIKNLKKNLECVLDQLKVLLDMNCTPSQAAQAWNWVFKHSFWDELIKKASDTSSLKKDGPILVQTTGPWWKDAFD